MHLMGSISSGGTYVTLRTVKRRIPVCADTESLTEYKDERGGVREEVGKENMLVSKAGQTHQRGMWDIVAAHITD